MVDCQLELHLEHPGAWFSNLPTPSKLIVGAGVFFIFCIYFFWTFLTDLDECHPDECKHQLYRLGVGFALQFGLIIYFWSEIYYFFRWWLPYKNLFLQLGSLALVCFCLFWFGYNIECGLLRGGIGRPLYSCMWGGLQRGRGLICVTAVLLGMLTILYSIIYIFVWIVGCVLALGQKLI
jgi:hypothetical protein